MISSGIRGSDIRTLKVTGYTPIRYNQCCEPSQPQIIEFNPRVSASAGIERIKQNAALQTAMKIETKPSPFYPQQDRIIYFRPPIFNESKTLDVENVTLDKTLPFPTRFQTAPTEPVQLRSNSDIVDFPRYTRAWPAFSVTPRDMNFEHFKPKQQISALTVPKFQKIKINENRNVSLEPTYFIPPRLNSYKNVNIFPTNKPKPLMTSTQISAPKRISHGFPVNQCIR